jgi:hypothetical protein
MKALHSPTGIKLVGIILICLLLQGLSSAEKYTSQKYSVDDIKEFHSDFVHHRGFFVTGEIPLCNNEAHNPWSSSGDFGYGSQRPELIPRQPPAEEKIHLNGSQAERRVGDLKALNRIDKRDIIYDESQIGGPSEVDSLDPIDVNIAGNVEPEDKLPDRFSEDNIEKIVDKTMLSKSKGSKAGSDVAGKDLGRNHVSGRMGNYMDISVSDITVSAINTVEGGSAVATSNIIIKPVQIIFCPSEVDEKLK